MGEPAVSFGSVPVLYFRRDRDDSPRLQAHRLFPLFLIPAAPGCADQDLSAAGFGMVNMPVVAAARLEGDVREEDGALPRFCQRVQIRIAGKILAKAEFSSPWPNMFALSNVVLSSIFMIDASFTQTL